MLHLAAPGSSLCGLCIATLVTGASRAMLQHACLSRPQERAAHPVDPDASNWRESRGPQEETSEPPAGNATDNEHAVHHAGGDAVVMPAYDEAIDHALGMLHSFLSPHLTYHNVWHTEGDVMIAADRLARMSNVSTDDRRLLSVAAAFHDTGFIACTVGHEDVGCELAGSTLPRYGFSDAQIDQIQHMVLATRVPQQPQTLLEAILADADLDALGRPDLFARQRALRQELAATGEGVVDDRTWLSSQLQFMRSHEFHTRAARTLRSAQKNYNTLMLQRQLSYVSNSNGNGVYHS